MRSEGSDAGRTDAGTKTDASASGKKKKKKPTKKRPAAAPPMSDNEDGAEESGATTQPQAKRRKAKESDGGDDNAGASGSSGNADGDIDIDQVARQGPLKTKKAAVQPGMLLEALQWLEEAPSLPGPDSEVIVEVLNVFRNAARGLSRAHMRLPM
jgi:hypothetical protein